MIPHTTKYLISRSISSADIPHVAKYLISRSTSSREVYHHAIYLITRGISSRKVPHQSRYLGIRHTSPRDIPRHARYKLASWEKAGELANGELRKRWQAASCEKLQTLASYKRIAGKNS
jgi:hypothetical protein